MKWATTIPAGAPVIMTVLCLAAVSVNCAQQDPQLARNKTTVMAAFDAIGRNAVGELDQYIASDYVRHCQATPEAVVNSLDDFKALIREWEATYSDVEMRLDAVIAERDLVAFYGTYRAKQTGPMGPFPATGKTMNSEFAGYHRLADGKIAETWVTWDNLAVLKQLGLFPPPPPAEAGGEK